MSRKAHPGEYTAPGGAPSRDVRQGILPNSCHACGVALTAKGQKTVFVSVRHGVLVCVCVGSLGGSHWGRLWVPVASAQWEAAICIKRFRFSCPANRRCNHPAGYSPSRTIRVWGRGPRHKGPGSRGLADPRSWVSAGHTQQLNAWRRPGRPRCGNAKGRGPASDARRCLRVKQGARSRVLPAGPRPLTYSPSESSSDTRASRRFLHARPPQPGSGPGPG